MKPRTPKSFAAAVTKIMSALSDDRCAQIVGRSDSLVRKWADPDHASLPTLHQALALDVIYAREGHGGTPIFEVYQELINAALDERDDAQVDLLFSALGIQGVVGNLSDAIRNALDPDGPCGTAITPRERQTILQILDKLDDQASLIEDAVEED